MSSWLFQSERLNLLSHCARFGRLCAANPGWSVRNELIPTRMFNFHTGWESLETPELERRCEGVAFRSSPTLLWAAPVPAHLRTPWRHVLTYKVLVSHLPTARPAHHAEVYGSARARPDGLAELMAAAHEEPRTLPYFTRLVTDPTATVVVNEGGTLALRAEFGLVGVYDLAVLPAKRDRGYATSLLTTAAVFAGSLGMPAVTHVRPDGAAWKAALRAGFTPWFDDAFYAFG